MPPPKGLKPLPGSEPVHPAGATEASGRPDSNEIVRVTLLLKPQAAEKERCAALSDTASRLPRNRRRLRPADLRRLFGPAPADLAAITEFARHQNLKVEQVSEACGHVVLSGPLAGISRAFGVELARFRHPRGSYRSHRGPVRVPGPLTAIVEAVLGLDDRPVVERHVIGRRQALHQHTEPADVARFYNFPDAQGRGQTVGIIELGGGFHPADIHEYFHRHNLRQPQINVVEIAGATNAPAGVGDIRKFWESISSENPGDDTGERDVERIGWTIETTMDVELAGALANAARIIVYFAPNTAQGKYQALAAALADGENQPSILSCSWGAHESTLSRPYVQSVQRLFEVAVQQGVTVCCSSGDDGDGAASGGKPQVNFPASSEYVLACGGTHLDLSASTKAESVWSETFAGRRMASTGGASKLFRAPAWQAPAEVRRKTGLNGRGVPDVAAKADVATGYCILAGGVDIPMGGTSAAAPLWAALIARINEKLGVPAGYITPLLYRPEFQRVFRDVTEGNNGSRFRAAPGWDPCTGWGSPHGAALLDALSGASLAAPATA